MTTHEAGLDPSHFEHFQGEAELAERIEGHIERRASGRIRDLHVICSDGIIILMGRSRTYHAKQLAQEAVLDLTEGRPALANQIVVS
jgi:BON domain